MSRFKIVPIHRRTQNSAPAIIKEIEGAEQMSADEFDKIVKKSSPLLSMHGWIASVTKLKNFRKNG